MRVRVNVLREIFEQYFERNGKLHSMAFILSKQSVSLRMIRISFEFG